MSSGRQVGAALALPLPDYVLERDPKRGLPMAQAALIERSQGSGQFFLNRHIVAGKGQPGAAQA